MTCYYYTNPLHAALMAEQFGIRMQFAGGDMQDISKHLLCTAVSAEVDIGLIFVHPDSDPLLEPRVGDIILDSDNEPRTVAKTRDNIILWAEEENYGWCYKSEVKIIQRNGMPFVWPGVAQ